MNLILFLLIFLFLISSVILLLILIIKLVITYKCQSKFPRTLTTITIGNIIVLLCLVMYRPLTYTFASINMNSPYIEQKWVTVSPDFKYTATLLYEPYGGAVGGVNIIVKIHSAENETKIIYYADAKDMTGISWIDNETLNILNKSSFDDLSISLNVTNEIFHGTGYACSSLLMKNKYDYCYSKHETK